MLDPNNQEDRRKLEIQAKKEERKKQLLIMKATKEMIEESKKGLIKRHQHNPSELNDLLSEFDKVTKDNEQVVTEYLKSSDSEIDNLEYNKVPEEFVERWNEKMKERGEGENPDTKYAEAQMGKKKKARTRKSKKENIETEQNVIQQEVKEKTAVMERNEKRKIEPIVADSGFDPSNVPSNVQYDVIPLPSKGECYAHKKGRVPVAYLTAADENLMLSPNIIRDGKIIEMILKRKILDTDFVFEEMCEGDIEAIVVWLRASAFGPILPMKLRNPDNGKLYDTDIDLSKVGYKPFNLKSDEDGLFTFTTRNGDILKFRYTNRYSMGEVMRKMRSANMAIDFENSKYFLRYANDIYNAYKKDNSDDEEFNDCLGVLNDIFDDVIEANKDDGNGEYTFMTDSVVLQTVSVNGDSDREFVRQYVEGMLLGDFKAYRKYIRDNEPGLDLTVTVNIPESDGGGSFESFLNVRDTIFLTD